MIPPHRASGGRNWACQTAQGIGHNPPSGSPSRPAVSSQHSKAWPGGLFSLIPASSAVADGHPDPHHFALGAGLILFAALLVAAIVRWQICVDDRGGLHRCCLLGWIAGPGWRSSRVSSGTGRAHFSLYWPDHERGPRVLRFGWMKIAERELLYQTIQRRWILPASEASERMAFSAFPVAKHRAWSSRVHSLGPIRLANVTFRPGPEGLSGLKRLAGRPLSVPSGLKHLIPWSDVRSCSETGSLTTAATSLG